MSGICGVFCLDRKAELRPSDILPMVETLAVSQQARETAIVNSLGLGVSGFHGQEAGIAKLLVHNCPCVLAFYGSPYNLTDNVTAFPAAERATTSEAEQILRAYVADGIEILSRLRGEFVLALWDGREETLYLATDRFRVHPLFYYQDAGKFVFASHIQSLLCCFPPLQLTIHSETIIDVIARSSIPTPKTIFREIQKIPPGHLLTHSHGKVSTSAYWDIDFLHPSDMAEAELAQKVKATFAESIAIRLREDGPITQVGTFLSGGVDSTTVTGVLTQLAGQPVKSFSIGFEERHFNEINYARIAARAFDVEHHEYFVTPQDTYDTLPVLLENFDEPFANASAVPTYLCAKLARQHGIEILYAGDGGDELFAGNERYVTQRLLDYYFYIPMWLRTTFVKPLTFALAERLQWSLLVKGKKYIERASIPYPQRLSSYGLFSIIPMAELFAYDFLQSIGESYNPSAPTTAYYFQAPAASDLDRQLYIDLKSTISDNDLLKVTRMTEAAGVTVRFPFLDHKFAEFAATIPASVKMKGRQLRSFFKNTYADLLPEEVRTKTKHGFGLPIPVWLRTDKQLNEMMLDLVLSPQTVQRGYFRRECLEALVDRHKTDPTSFYGTILWHLMVLELWQRKYEKNGCENVTSRAYHVDS